MKGFKIIILSLVVLSAIGFALGSGVSLVEIQKPQDPKKETNVKENEGFVDKEDPYLDLTADVIMQRAAKDSTVYLVGNVAFHHNGAIIQCDSAARYTNTDKIDFFGKVIIFKDSAYIYGDKVSYDSKNDMAQVFAPLVKMVRGDVTLYSYNLTYNTKSNIAYFENGGIMNKEDAFMESNRGEFNADLNIVKFIDSVSMRSDDYDIKTDSLNYNVDTEVVTFLTRTYIWDKDSSIMEANRGYYFTQKETYEFFDSAYIMTKEQEMWADTMNYYTEMRQATMRRNVQVLDTVNRTIGFGDWAFYDDSLGVAILTRTPSVRSYNAEKNDTTYMRGDTLFMTTYEARRAVGAKFDSTKIDSTAIDSTIVDSTKIDSTVVDSTIVDSTKIDSTVVDSTILDSTRIDDPVIDSTIIVSPEIDRVEVDSTSVGLGTESELEAVMRKTGRDSMLNQQGSAKGTFDQMMRNKQKVLDRDSSHSARLDSIAKANQTVLDSISKVADSLKVAGDSVGAIKKIEHREEISQKMKKVTDSIAQTHKSLTDSTKFESPDSIYKTTTERIFRAYYNVRMWSLDNQAICDSMIAFSVDSVAQMHGSPIIWSDNSQITAEQVNAYSANDQLDWVEFLGDPFVTQSVEPKYPEPADTGRFNQATGKLMFAYFRDNEIDSVIMSGNVINYYYMESDGYTSAFGTITCADMVIFFDQRKVDKIRWEGKSDWQILPMEKIPETQSQRLEGFSWQQEKRPKSAKEISDRYLRPSRRAQMVEISKPSWDIEKRIEDYRKVILENGIWTDRTDVNTITVEYFQQQNTML